MGCVWGVLPCHLFDPGFDRHADPHLPEVGLAHAEQRAELFVGESGLLGMQQQLALVLPGQVDPVLTVPVNNNNNRSITGRSRSYGTCK